MPSARPRNTSSATSELETMQRAVNEVLLLRDELEASGEPHLSDR